MGERHGPSHIHNQLAVIITHTHTYTYFIFIFISIPAGGGREKKREQLIVECHIIGIIWFIPYKNPI